MENIELDALRNLSHPANMDNFASRYKVEDTDLGITLIYPSYELETLENNYFRLLYNSVAVDFKPRWYMRPDYTSYDVYGTTIFWYIILFVNSIHSIEEYQGLSKVLIPYKSIISELITEKIPRSDIRNIKFEDTEDNRIKIFLNSKNDLRDKVITPKQLKMNNDLDETINLPSIKEELIEVQDIFTLTQKDIDNKYIILKRKIVNESSISVYMSDLVIPLRYGYDYVCKNNRIYWDSSIVIGNSSTLDQNAYVGLKLRAVYLTSSK